ncbi:probable inactive histone-lysine N-methyltransferase SUVR1 isoform X3 [Arabidopsis lyrata subsp. lyrata]|uniref:probable inactive histone-lysine N-methyltransferase SUVR1 isoform X3 n=1 Tax=Arabidopsis lyrata subsp. lyrata TaxID=81972 RepID=UPI000A29BDCE|nr:probable inactive histone-lysine N-methyltransferase SUVR1 isoform X3 [Arabidopsis lyrata subsp. lyrata]|eukprot:XP_020870721.1 probable inactive histone-lysine N-methyltransferase SUVR1 isoform X3 [Arabidopsis lyrata subsp. lyrata]
MAPNPKIKKACDAMKLLGISETKTRAFLRKLLKAYDNNWDFIEDEAYKVLLDAIFDEADAQSTEKKKKEEEKKSKNVATSRGRRKAPEQTQPLVQDEEDDMDEDETPLKRRLRSKRGRCSEYNTNLSECSPKSQKPNKEDPKTQPEEEEEDEDDDVTELPPLKRYLRRSGERGLAMTVYNNASPSSSSRTSMEPKGVPPMLLIPADPIQDEKDSEADALIILNDEPNIDHKSVILGNCSAPMLEIEKSNIHVEERDRETKDNLNDTIAMDVSPSAIGESSEHKVAAASVELASSTSGEAKIYLSFAPATGETTNLCLPSMEDLRRAMEEKCLKSYKIVHPKFSVLGFMKDMCSCYIDLAKNSTSQSLETETICDISKAGDESGAAGISMGLVVVPECEISEDGLRAISNMKDITAGEENIEIPWVNEINDKVPSCFRYMRHSFVFQDAPVKFSLSSFSDEQSCSFSCIEDCLASEMSCNCAIAFDNVFAYSVNGLLKEEFLEARISEARDQRKQVLQFCEECPLERAKKVEILEPCKGHLKRGAIKECWIKCGCTKICGNRVIQRGIQNKLQVFFTPNGKGWGLRTLEKLPKGAFICEYIGEILTIPELYQRSFEGFLNHRCLDANLIEIPVQVETPDQHYYHLAFFTTRDIEAMEELTWDYGVDFNDDESLMKPFDCLCGSRFCRNKKRSKKIMQIMNKA